MEFDTTTILIVVQSARIDIALIKQAVKCSTNVIIFLIAACVLESSNSFFIKHNYRARERYFSR